MAAWMNVQYRLEDCAICATIGKAGTRELGACEMHIERPLDACGLWRNEASRSANAAYSKTNQKDWRMRKLGLSLTLAISIGAGTGAFSQSAAPTLDPAWKAPEVVAFIGLKAGRSEERRVGKECRS